MQLGAQWEPGVCVRHLQELFFFSISPLPLRLDRGWLAGLRESKRERAALLRAKNLPPISERAAVAFAGFWHTYVAPS